MDIAAALEFAGLPSLCQAAREVMARQVLGRAGTEAIMHRAQILWRGEHNLTDEAHVESAENHQVLEERRKPRQAA